MTDKLQQLKAKVNIPPIGMGTFGSDRYDAETVANAVYTAIKVGYRLFDCASVYGNEKQIGGVFKRAFDDKIVKREDLIITGKVWNDMHGDGDVIKSCKQSIDDLGIGHIDIFFVHWPFPNYHARGCSVDSRNPDSTPFFTEEFMKVWTQMEWLKDNGLVKQIAMSNMTLPKFEEVLPLCRIKPFAHEMELHPSFQQQELFDYCVDRDILPIGYCPLGSPNRPERDKMAEDVVDTAMPEIVGIAARLGIHPADVCLRWAVKRGQVPIPFASREVNIVNNLNSAYDNLLTDDDMRNIAAADKNCRLVKGHVFLWNGADDWNDLWDNGNVIDNWKLQGNTWIKE